MDPRKFFEEELPSKAAENKDKLAGMNATYKFVIDGSGTWVVAINDGELTITEGDGDAQCTVQVSADDFSQILAGTLNPQMAFMSGKLKIQGDMSLAMKLGTVLN